MVSDDVAKKFFDTLESHGVHPDEIETISSHPDSMFDLSLQLKRVLPEAEASADLVRRRADLSADIDTLDDEGKIIAAKLRQAGYDLVYKAAMATDSELSGLGVFTGDELQHVNDALRELGFGGLRPSDTSKITRLLELWDEWRYIPAEVRKLYGI